MRKREKAQIEKVLHCIPGYNAWDQAGDSWLDHDAAAKAINWFADHLKHVEGSARGEPFILRPWQAAIVGNLFGWKRLDESGRTVRRYRRFLLYIGRGNGKTPLASGICLYSLCCDGEAGAQIYLAAGKSEQAGFLFRNCRGMVEQDDEMHERIRIYGGDQHKSLVLNDDPLASCKVIPADGSTMHGAIPHVVLIDELHAQQTRYLFDAFETALSKKARPQPIFGMITTADSDRPSICNEVYEYAKRVRDNGGDKDKPGFDPGFLPIVYEVPQDADWTDDNVWKLANPNLGVSVSHESLRDMCRKAKENPAAENAFRRYHLNQCLKQDIQIIRMDAWDRCKVASLRMEDFSGQPCWAGVDLSSKEDLTSVAVAFDTGDGRTAVFVTSWCPSEKAAIRARRKFPYDVWAKNNWLVITKSDSMDYGLVREYLIEIRSKHDLKAVAFDPSNARETINRLQEEHGLVDIAYELGQTLNNLSSPTKEFLDLIRTERLQHDGNPVLRWAAGNLSLHYGGTIPPGQDISEYLDKVPIMPSKRKSADKIDPVAATVCALHAKSMRPVMASMSVYETRGIECV